MKRLGVILAVMGLVLFMVPGSVKAAPSEARFVGNWLLTADLTLV